jgi:hypothetical protein
LAKGLVDATPNQRDLWDKLVASVSLSRSGTAFAGIASRSVLLKRGVIATKHFEVRHKYRETPLSPG